jgi:hypothetical protein
VIEPSCDVTGSDRQERLLHRLEQGLMVERETPKRSATSFLGMPRSMAASVFNLRSFEYAFMESMLVQVRYLRKPLSEYVFSKVHIRDRA